MLNCLKANESRLISLCERLDETINSIEDCSRHSCSADTFVKKKWMKQRHINLERKGDIIAYKFSSIVPEPVVGKCTIKHILKTYRKRESCSLKHLSFHLQPVLFALLSKESRKGLPYGVRKSFANFLTRLV